MSLESETTPGLAERSTPWFVVTNELLPDLDIEGFAEDHDLDREALVAEVLSGLIEDEVTIAALARETGLSEDFFRNLTNRYKTELAKQKEHAGLKPGTHTDSRDTYD